MTLHTRIAVTSPDVDPDQAFRYARHLLGAQEHTYSTQRYGSSGWMMNPDQQLPALMWVEHHHGKKLPLFEDQTHDVNTGDEWSYQPATYTMIHFDTGYFYSGWNGAACGDLHAWLVREIGQWLDHQNAPWTWQDESGDGWVEEWDASFLAYYGEWGTLGDPDVGHPHSMIPAYRDDSRYDFLQTVHHALNEQNVEWYS